MQFVSAFNTSFLQWLDCKGRLDAWCPQKVYETTQLSLALTHDANFTDSANLACRQRMPKFTSEYSKCRPWVQFFIKFRNRNQLAVTWLIHLDHWSYALPYHAGYSNMKTPDSNQIVAAYARKVWSSLFFVWFQRVLALTGESTSSLQHQNGNANQCTIAQPSGVLQPTFCTIPPARVSC